MALPWRPPWQRRQLAAVVSRTHQLSGLEGLGFTAWRGFYAHCTATRNTRTEGYRVEGVGFFELGIGLGFLMIKEQHATR